MFRAFVAALALAAFASPALALEPREIVGEWQTEWANAGGQAPEGGGPMRVSLDSSRDSLDGVTPGPGWDGLMNGEVSQENGQLVWSGAWVSVWCTDVTRGTFRFVFSDANTFTGTWSTDDGEIQNAAWNGRRAR